LKFVIVVVLVVVVVVVVAVAVVEVVVLMQRINSEIDSNVKQFTNSHCSVVVVVVVVGSYCTYVDALSHHF